MIGAFGRWTKNPALIIRAGEDAKEYGDDYDSQTVCTVDDDEFATFEGNAKDSVLGEHYEITNDRLKAAIHVANEMTGRPVQFARLGDDDPHWLQQVSGVDGKGPIRMERKDIPDVRATKHHKGRTGNNQIDKDTVIATAEQLIAGYKAGAVDVVLIETTEIAKAGHKRRARVVLEVELP